MKPWNKVAIVGVGLIGGSIGLALLRRNLVREVVGIGRSEANLETAQRLGAVTSATTQLPLGVSGADLVIVCTPVARIAQDVCQVAQAVGSECLITDAGSTKSDIVREIESAASAAGWKSGVRFVGSHPLAGSEKRGPENANAELFVNRTVIVTPAGNTKSTDIELLRNLWTGLGAKVVEMSPSQHDEIMATTSHVPHVVAAAMAAATPSELVRLTAGGWQDTTRIAGGDPDLWQQILLSNRDNVLRSLEQFEQRLGSLKQAVKNRQQQALQELLMEAKQTRDAVGS
jgi:prephenate dehydrogenase